MPQVGKPAFVRGDADHPDTGYQSAYSHADESASAGYYKVKLQKSGVTAELTAGERAGILRFTFPASDEASIMTDLNHVIIGGRGTSRNRASASRTIPPSPDFIWSTAGPRNGIFILPRVTRARLTTRKSSATASRSIYNTYRFRSHNEAAGTNLQFLAKYKTHAGEVIQVKVAVSAVSAANALQNLDAEIPDWNFEKLREATRAKWDQRIEQHSDRRFARTEGNFLHLALSRVSRAESVSGRERRVSRL